MSRLGRAYLMLSMKMDFQWYADLCRYPGIKSVYYTRAVNPTHYALKLVFRQWLMRRATLRDNGVVDHWKTTTVIWGRKEKRK